jgi:hypothetical protein
MPWVITLKQWRGCQKDKKNDSATGVEEDGYSNQRTTSGTISHVCHDIICVFCTIDINE